MGLLQILKETTIQDKLLILVCCLFQYIFAFGFSAIPFWYMNPKFECLGADGKYTLCSQQQACASKNYQINTEGITSSITIQNNLYCEARIVLTFGQTVNISGIAFMCVLYTVVQTELKIKYILITIGFFLSGLAAILATVVQNLYVVFFIFGLFAFGTFNYNLNIYSFYAAYMDEKIKMVLLPIQAAFYSLAFFIYPIYDKIFQRWQPILIYFYAIPCIVCSLLFYYLVKTNIMSKYENKDKIPTDIEKNGRKKKLQKKLLENNKQLNSIKKNKSQQLQQQQQQQNVSNLNDLKDLSIVDLFKNRYLKKINYIYCILIFGSGFSYVSSQFSLETLPGSIYTNYIILGVLQILFTLVSAGIILKYQPKKLVIWISVECAICFCLFIFKTEGSTNLIFFFAYLIGKASLLTSCVYNLALLQKFAPVNAVSPIFIFANVVTNVATLIIPTYNQIMINLGINPLILYGFLNVLAIISMYYYDDTQDYRVQMKEGEIVEIPAQKAQIELQALNNKVKDLENDVEGVTIYQNDKKNNTKQFKNMKTQKLKQDSSNSSNEQNHEGYATSETIHDIQSKKQKKNNLKSVKEDSF